MASAGHRKLREITQNRKKLCSSIGSEIRRYPYFWPECMAPPNRLYQTTLNLSDDTTLTSPEFTNGLQLRQ